MKIKLIVEDFKRMRDKGMMKIVRKAPDLSESCLGKTKIVEEIIFILSPSQFRPALWAYVAVRKSFTIFLMNEICLNQHMKIKLLVEHFKKTREKVMMKIV